MSDRKNQSNTDKENLSGSLANSEPDFLVIGKVGRTHGLKGELWMNIYTDFPERLESGKSIFIGSQHERKIISSFKISGARGLVHFQGINTPEEANRLKNQLIYVEGNVLPDLPEGEYYHHDLIGMLVLDENRKQIGILSEILSTGANDVYVVRDPDDEKKEVLVPAVPSVILEVDVPKRTMVIKPQEWT